MFLKLNKKINLKHTFLPALYRVLLAGGLITLPSMSYLHRLSGAYHLETGLSSSTIAYLTERIKPLSDTERTVAIQIDEVSKYINYCLIKGSLK